MSVWNRRGAILPLTILVIAVLGVSVAITSNGSNNARGAVIAGLDVKLGDSCALTRALGHIGSLQRVRNGWNDTWPSY